MLNIKDLENNFKWLKEGQEITAHYLGSKFTGVITDLRANLYGSRNIQYCVEVLEDFLWLDNTETKKKGDSVFIYLDNDGFQVEG